jgi:hypothetical protein
MTTSGLRKIGKVGVEVIRAAAAMSLILLILDAMNVDVLESTAVVRLRFVVFWAILVSLVNIPVRTMKNRFLRAGAI